MIYDVQYRGTLYNLGYCMFEVVMLSSLLHPWVFRCLYASIQSLRPPAHLKNLSAQQRSQRNDHNQTGSDLQARGSNIA